MRKDKESSFHFIFPKKAGVRPEPAERDGQGVAGVELVTRSSSQSEKSTQGEMREREGDPTRRVLDFSSKGGRR